MLAQERLDIILNMLHENNTVKISDISDRLEISNLTARRDLDILQDQGIVKRVYGGAILVRSDTVSSPLSQSPYNPIPSKASHHDLQAIGKAAAAEVCDGDTLFLGPGSTVLSVAKYLHDRKNLTILTNSLVVINELASTNCNIFVLGGLLDGNEHSMTDSFTKEMLSQFCAAKAFIGCGGVSVLHGVSDYSSSTAQTCALMAHQATRTYLVCSSKKFGRDAFAVTCPLSDIHTIITDDELDKEYRSELAQTSVRLTLVSSGK